MNMNNFTAIQDQGRTSYQLPGQPGFFGPTTLSFERPLADLDLRLDDRNRVKRDPFTNEKIKAKNRLKLQDIERSMMLNPVTDYSSVFNMLGIGGAPVGSAGSQAAAPSSSQVMRKALFGDAPQVPRLSGNL